MTDIRPFGETVSSGDPNVGVQTFCNATVKDFMVQADWSGQGGKLTVTLVEDTTDKFQVPVINSPKYFELTDVDSNVLFQFGGVVESVNRETMAGSAKIYTVTLASPAKILNSVSVNMEGYAGYGGTIEGIPSLISKDGHYDIGARSSFPEGYAEVGIETTNSQTFLRYDKYSYGSNNNASGIDWNSNYNVMNVFGAYENDDYYLFEQIKGFGSAGVSSAGMRFDRVMFALHDMINQTNSSQGKRYLGGNILYGTDTYNINLNANPYYYGFDAIGFYEQVYAYLPGDFRIPAPNSTLLEIIQTVCEEANMEFIIDIENSLTFTSGIDARPILKTYPNSTFGGTIFVRTFPKNAPRDPSRPYSILSSVLLGLEIPDKSDFGVGNVNPGVDPGGYADPFEDDYTLTGTDGSAPYGGKFPVATKNDYAIANEILDRVKSLSLSVQATDQIASRFVVGGKQSRIVRVGRDNIYQYWGELTFIDSFTPGSSGTLDTDYRKIPVVTPILPANDVNDFILIDMQDIISTGNICNCARRGIYVASQLEIRMAMDSVETWDTFMETMKPKKLACLTQYVKNIVGFSGTQESSKVVDIVGAIDATADEITNIVVPTLSSTIQMITGNQNTSQQVNTTLSRLFQNTKNTVSSAVGQSYGKMEQNFVNMFEELKGKIYERIKAVGDEHYGQSWFVAMPYPDVKLTVDDTNIIGNFEKSWDISETAYLEPYSFSRFEAPRSNIFVTDGRISAYVNYEHSFTTETVAQESGAYTDIFSDTTSFYKSGEAYAYDFKEYDKDSKVLSFITRGLVHVKPENVSDYHILNPDYFTIYDRNKLPYNKIVDGSYSGVAVYDENVAGDQASPIPQGRASLGSNLGYGSGTPDLGARMRVMRPIIDSLSSANIPDHGLDCLHFVKVNTKRVYYPTMDMDGYLDFHGPTSDQMAKDTFKSMNNGSIPAGFNSTITRSVAGLSDLAFTAFPAVIPPLSIAIPQTSNRYYYGPWVTSFEKKYAGKVEYVHDEDLVPENFLMPEFGIAPNPFNFNFNLTNTISGMAGLNLAGQAKANSIDGSSVFAEEQGTVTMAGAPLISRIGDALILNSQTIGPYITDISVRMNENSIETVYNFRTYTPRQNRTNRDIIKNLTKLSNTIKKVTRGK